MRKRSNGQAIHPVWFWVAFADSTEGHWVRARDEHEAVREWCKDRDREDFWRYVNTAVVETLYGGLDTHHPDRPCGLAKAWRIDASQPPAWIIERIAQEN